MSHGYQGINETHMPYEVEIVIKFIKLLIKIGYKDEYDLLWTFQHVLWASADYHKSMLE